VINLMDALRQSVAAGRGGGEKRPPAKSTTRRSRGRTGARKRKSPAKRAGAHARKAS
jgi:hypothetical protein